MTITVWDFVWLVTSWLRHNVRKMNTDAPQPQFPVHTPPAAPKKSNKTAWIVIGAIGAVVLLACCGIGAAVFVLNDDKPSASGSENSDADSGSDADNDSKKEKSAKIGDTVKDGDFEFTVTKVEDGVAKVGDEYLEKEASGQFVIVHVTVKNVGEKADLFSDTEQKIIDVDGKEYDADSEAGIYIKDNQALLDNINPGNDAKVQLVFDVPDKVKLDSIKLAGNFGSDGVSVKLK